MVTLVVGANGQLGAKCCAELLKRGEHVRGTVRHLDRAGTLTDLGVDLVELELTQPQTFAHALADVDVVVLTASAMTPRAEDDPEAVDRGTAQLIDAAPKAGVRRLIMPSLPADERFPVVRARTELERRLLASPMEGVVLRFPPFMECWLALVGSSLPLRGEPYATIGRPSPFPQSFRRRTGSLVEDRGVMLVPGSPKLRNAFIATDDVARACAEAVDCTDASGRVHEIAGPEVLSWRQVADVFASVLGRRVRIMSTPGLVYSVAYRALRPVATVPSRVMSLNALIASTETAWSPGGGGLLDPAGMQTVHEFISAKAALPAELPDVA